MIGSYHCEKNSTSWLIWAMTNTEYDESGVRGSFVTSVTRSMVEKQRFDKWLILIAVLNFTHGTKLKCPIINWLHASKRDGWKHIYKFCVNVSILEVFVLTEKRLFYFLDTIITNHISEDSDWYALSSGLICWKIYGSGGIRTHGSSCLAFHGLMLYKLRNRSMEDHEFS